MKLHLLKIHNVAVSLSYSQDCVFIFLNLASFQIPTVSFCNRTYIYFNSVTGRISSPCIRILSMKLTVVNQIKTFLAIYTYFILGQSPFFFLVDQSNFSIYTQDSFLLLQEITTIPHPALAEVDLHLHS
jgi:hypothetical protein